MSKWPWLGLVIGSSLVLTGCGPIKHHQMADHALSANLQTVIDHTSSTSVTPSTAARQSTKHHKPAHQVEQTEVSKHAQTGSITISGKVVSKLFGIQFEGVTDLQPAVEAVTKQVDAYLTSIKNLNEYQVSITSVDPFDVEGEYGAQAGTYRYETTVYLIRKN